jgi:hypothetical protein
MLLPAGSSVGTITPVWIVKFSVTYELAVGKFTLVCDSVHVVWIIFWQPVVLSATVPVKLFEDATVTDAIDMSPDFAIVAVLGSITITNVGVTDCACATSPVPTTHIAKTIQNSFIFTLVSPALL